MTEETINDDFKITFVSNRKLMIPKVLINNSHRYELQKLIIEVRNCVVLATSDPETSKKLAVKCIPVSIFRLNPREFELISSFDNENIVKTVDFFPFPNEINPRFIAIVMPRATSDLLDYLNYYQFLPEPIVYKIMKDSLEGLRTIHEADIWHRDIKLDNLFILAETRQGPLVAIGDFGLADHIDREVFESQGVGTVEYSAPELLELTRNGLRFKQHAQYTKKVDLWSMGVVMFSLLCGKLPFDRSSLQSCQRLLNGEVTFEPLTDDPNDPFNNFQAVSEEAKDLITSLMCLDPNNRYSVEEALNHPWFSMFQQEAVEFEQENDGIFNALDDERNDFYG